MGPRCERRLHSLIHDQDRVFGVATESVPLGEVEEAAEIAALRSLVLDFDRDGKLVGIQVLSPESVLRDSALREGNDR